MVSMTLSFVDFLMSSSMGRDWIPVHQDREINSLSTLLTLKSAHFVVRFYNKIYRKKLWKLCNTNNQLKHIAHTSSSTLFGEILPKDKQKEVRGPI